MKNLKIQSNFFSSVSEITNLYYKNKFNKYIKTKFNILDFGCGSGEFLDLIKCKFKIGVEKNNLSLKKVRNKKINCVNKLENLNKKIKFDTIFALSVIDHLDDPALFIKKLKNKLKRSGQIIIIIRHDSKDQNLKNSSYKEHLYSWSLLSFNNLLNSIGLKTLDEGVVKMTLPPGFNFLKKILNVRYILIISKIYYYLNFKDRRFYFVCKKK
jgi:SAM-dependent methyltransferase